MPSRPVRRHQPARVSIEKGYVCLGCEKKYETHHTDYLIHLSRCKPYLTLLDDEAFHGEHERTRRSDVEYGFKTKVHRKKKMERKLTHAIRSLKNAKPEAMRIAKKVCHDK